MIARTDDGRPLDIIYLFRHSKHQDAEIRYSLRSVARCLPFVRKVWVFGSRPAFLSDDTTIVEHVPHEYMAPLLGLKTPVRNDFLMLALAAMIPGVAFDFLRFSDDYIVLEPLTREEVCTVRGVEDLSRAKSRGEGKWKAMLWRTYDLLREHGYGGINFESHTPMWMTRQLVFEAFMAFRPYLSEDRFQGMHAGTAIGNYGVRHQGLSYAMLAENRSPSRSHSSQPSPIPSSQPSPIPSPRPSPIPSPRPSPIPSPRPSPRGRGGGERVAWGGERVGFYGQCPDGDAIAAACEGKQYLNFDEEGFGPPMAALMEKLFPEPCKYERSEAT